MAVGSRVTLLKTTAMLKMSDAFACVCLTSLKLIQDQMKRSKMQKGISRDMLLSKQNTRNEKESRDLRTQLKSKRLASLKVAPSIDSKIERLSVGY